jgi:DNA-binding CsgD family transcriptional regulator
MGDGLVDPHVLERIHRARSLTNLRMALHDIIPAFDLQHAAYCGVPPLDEADTQSWIVVVTYPDAWVRHYVAEDYFRVDPVVTTARHTFLPIDWSDLRADDPLSRKLFDEATEFGIGRHGMSFPIRGPGGDFALFNVTADVSDADWPVLKERRFAQWMALGHAIHRRLLEIAGRRMLGEVTRLSPREQEVLEATAHGLNADKVAAKIGLSERVVRGHLQTCRHKLNARNSTHAVARAVKLGLVAVA